MRFNFGTYLKSRIKGFVYLGILLVVLLIVMRAPACFSRLVADDGDSGTVAYVEDVMSIDEYTVEADVGKDRKVHVNETVVMTPKRAGSVFTRYLPLERDRYFDIVATSEADGFSYDVEEGDCYLNVNCRLPSAAGQTRVFRFSYVMEIGRDDVKNGMALDVVGYGWGVTLHNVRVTVNLPASVHDGSYTVYSGGYGATGNEADVQTSVSDDGKTVRLAAEKLSPVYSEYYDERMAQGITLRFALAEGALDGHMKTRLFTDDLWWILLVGLAITAVALCASIFLKKRRDIVSVVNLRAPEGMDPLAMGKLLDGRIDNEDVTSMIYYFASKGYLEIDLSNENDPVLIQKISELPTDAPDYQHTLFEGLFRSGDRVPASALKEKFYKAVDMAKKQVPNVPMYEMKSCVGFYLGGVLGALFAFFATFAMGMLRVGGGYYCMDGVGFAIPVVVIWVLGIMREDYRYKWKPKKQRWMLFAQIAVATLVSAWMIWLFPPHIYTEYEKFFLCLFTFLPTFLTLGTLSRTEKYCQTLGEVLGFKDFIVVTEEERIRFMLEESPDLYYDVLPYAQVLGVTEEWEKKFANITIGPSAWCKGMNATVFDYVLFHRCMMRATVTMTARPQPKGNGTRAGRSGGGGSFGGFGGGGHGGGGGGWR